MSYAHLTLVMALPRSRTAWLAHTFGQVVVARHEPLADCESIRDLVRLVDTLTVQQPGLPILLVDTAAVFFHQELAEQFPGASWLFIERDPAQVSASLARIGLARDIDLAVDYYQAAIRAAQRGDIRRARIQSHALSHPATLDVLLAWLGFTGMARPDGFWDAAIKRNIQVPIHQLARGPADPRKLEALFATRRNL